MARTGLGWRAHSGWAVLVVVRESPTSPEVLDRQRIELVDGSLPRQPYHAIVDRGLSLPAGDTLIERVEKMSIAAAVAATKVAIEQFRVEAIGVVGRKRNIPDELERILASHALLHAAEGYLFEHALVESAARVALPVHLLDPATATLGAALSEAGRVLGPPWQKDHKLAAACALAALAA